MTCKAILAAAALLGVAACADSPEHAAQTTPAPAPSRGPMVAPPAPESATPPTGSDASATSPMTVNPAPKGQSLPKTPPTLPGDPAGDDKSMPPGPVN